MSYFRHGHNQVGMRSATYSSWTSMKDRCDNPNNPAYNSYGGRGITYDPRWRLFDNFLSDMGSRPRNKTLERVDNNGPYNKDNCVWATRQEQSNNTRRNNLITHNGRTQTIAQWARETGLHKETIRSRWAQTDDTNKVFAPKHLRQGLYANAR